MKKTKILCWNINGYRSIVGQNPSKKYDTISRENKLFAFIEKEKPDIVCMQETKADLSQINEDLRQPAGYTSFYNSSKTKKGYSGVAIFTKEQPKQVIDSIGIERFDIEGRFLQADYDGFSLLNIYFPKGYADNERLDYKLEFYDAVFEYLEKLKRTQKNIIITGDYNTAHKEIDLARPNENVGTSGFIPVEREKLDVLVEKGFLDAFRLFTSDGSNYTWWSQRGRARENNVGWRIDYFFISENLKNNVKNCYLLPEIQGSDHCPLILELGK